MARTALYYQYRKGSLSSDRNRLKQEKLYEAMNKLKKDVKKATEQKNK